MGLIKNLYEYKYRCILEKTLECIEDESESFLENIRDASYEQVLPQIEQVAKELSKQELELMRVDCLRQLDDIKNEIRESWVEVAKKTAVSALTYTYISYTILIPSIAFLLFDKIAIFQIYIVVAILLVLLINITPIRNNITYYLYGINKTSNKLSDLYLLYGSVEATINTADYRKLCCVDRTHWVFSSHHQKLPD